MTLDIYETVLGSIILAMSLVMGATLFLAPGSIRLQRPQCGWIGWIFNLANLLFFFLLIPISGIVLVRHLDPGPWFRIELEHNIWGLIIEIQGLILFVLGTLLLLWSRLSLRRSFRLGGVPPSRSDYLTMHGPYNYIRHPMYLSALLTQVGVAILLCSAIYGIMALIMVFLILKLMPAEEKLLDRAYPIAYGEYCHRVKGALFPRG